MKMALLSCGHKMAVLSGRPGQVTTCTQHGAVTLKKFIRPPEPNRPKLKWWQTPGCAG